MATALGYDEEVKKEQESVYDKIKHPLQHAWSFWMYTNTKKTWEENLVELMTFETVEDYWCLYHSTKTPSELMMGQDYAIFKKGIRPMWEDPANRRGGRWLVSFDKKRTAEFDNVWLYANQPRRRPKTKVENEELKAIVEADPSQSTSEIAAGFGVLLSIGENFDFGEEICGVVANVRAKSKVALWVRNARNKRAVMQTGRCLREQLPTKVKLWFQVHNSNSNQYTL